MADKLRTYDVPAGAVFEAAQIALRQLKLKIKTEDLAEKVISASSQWTIKSFGQDITLRMSEVGMRTELAISTSSGQLTDWGEGQQIIARILVRIDVELERIEAEGRISRPKPQVYSFAESVAKPSSSPISLPPPQVPASIPWEKQTATVAPIAPPPPPQHVTQPAVVEAKSSGGNWLMWSLILGGLFWLFFTAAGKEFLSSFMKSVWIETDIAKYDCDMAGTLIEGESLQNIFGGRFTVIQVSSLSEVTHTEEKIVCTATVDLSDGRAQQMRITVEKGANAGEILYRAEPI